MFIKERICRWRVDNFVVAGEVLGVGQGSVRVRIKKNRGSGKPFNLSLKGTFDYDPSHKFYRFELRRKGKSYHIVRWKKVGLSAQTSVDKPATAVDKKGSKKDAPKDKQKLIIVSYNRKKVLLDFLETRY